MLGKHNLLGEGNKLVTGHETMHRSYSKAETQDKSTVLTCS